MKQYIGAIVVLLSSLSLYTNSPRLLIKVSNNMDFTPSDLQKKIGGSLIEGKNSIDQINDHDAKNENHLLILNSPIDKLKFLTKKKGEHTAPLDALGIVTGYKILKVTGSLDTAIQQVQDLLPTLPTTDACFERLLPEQINAIYNLLMHAQKVFKKHGLKYWAHSYGTLVAAARHKGLMPWDDGLGIGIATSDIETLEALRKDLQEEKLALVEHTPFDFYKIYPIDGQTIEGENSTGAPHKWKYPNIDIFPMHQHEHENVIRYKSTFLQKDAEIYYLPEELNGSFEELPFGPTTMPVPHNYTTIIERIHDKSWRNTVYKEWNRANETHTEKLKVLLTDFSAAQYTEHK